MQRAEYRHQPPNHRGTDVTSVQRYKTEPTSAASRPCEGCYRYDTHVRTAQALLTYLTNVKPE